MPASEDPAVPELLRRLRAGDSQAAEELFGRYSRRLIALADRQLSQKLAPRLEGEDVVQSAFRSFFRRDARGDFRLDASLDLWRLLVKITLNKARAKARHHTTEGRDVGAEIARPDPALAEFLARSPGPDEAAILGDQIDALLEGLPEQYGSVLRLRLEGHSMVEVARNLGISRHTVRRVLRLFQNRLTENE